ncbi:MAG: DUF4097 family beta strand repeat-containing protein [Acidimicrobiales bacterium]
MQSFDTPRGVDLRITNRAGHVEVTTHDRAVTEVDVVALHPDAESLAAETRVAARDRAGRLEVVVEVPESPPRPESLSQVGVQVRAPHRAGLTAVTASADVRAHGQYADGEIRTASGDVTILDVAGDLSVRTASGDIDVASVGGDLRADSASGDQRVHAAAGPASLHTASGDIRIDRAEASLEVRAASGDVRIGQALGDLTAQTASGDVRADCLHQGKMSVQSAAGDITLGVAPGTLLHVDAQTLSGDTSSEIPLDEDGGADAGAGSGRGGSPVVELRAKTVSGDIRVVRAPVER